MNKTETEKTKKGLLIESDIDCLSAVSEDGSVLLMAYNFKNDLEYSDSTDLTFNINAPQLDGKNVEIKIYRIDDSCNYFDEWVEDRKAYSISDSCFGWSPDCPVIENAANLMDENARNIYFSGLKDKYAKCSVLTPETTNVTVENGTITLTETVAANAVVFVEINPVD